MSTLRMSEAVDEGAAKGVRLVMSLGVVGRKEPAALRCGDGVVLRPDLVEQIFDTRREPACDRAVDSASDRPSDVDRLILSKIRISVVNGRLHQSEARGNERHQFSAGYSYSPA